MNNYIFTVDGGGTKTKGILYSCNGDELASHVGNASNLFRGVDNASCVVRELWKSVCDKVGASPQSMASQTKFVGGIAGAQFGSDRDQFVKEIGEFSSKNIYSDGFLALIAATNGKPGCLIVVGTGVVGVRLKHDGTCKEIGGWGFPIADIGGGAWLGRRVVTDYVQWLDEGNFKSSMWDRIGNHVGTNKSDILNWSLDAAPSKFGRLAPIVIQAMEAGDRMASEIFSDGIEKIYSLSMALKDDGQVCYYAGGLSKVVVRELNSKYDKANARLTHRNSNWGAYLLGVGDAPKESAGY